MKIKYLAIFVLSVLVFSHHSYLFASTKPHPPKVDPADPLLQLGYLDVTQKPYFADPTGVKDSTAALQSAVNDARDFQFVCFFPKGVYLISDTLSCEQKVSKIEVARQVDHKGMTQNYWGERDKPCILIGSKKNGRPLIKLDPNAKSFSDPKSPKPAIKFWAQTRDSLPGTNEPEWGKDQSTINFNQTFKGIDIDVSGCPGAAGIQHKGSQGSTMEDVRVNAEGAYAGINGCPGQAGGTHNIEIIGGDYALIAEPDTRFPMINGLQARGQKKAVVKFSGVSLPLIIMGFNFELNKNVAVSLKTNQSAGVSLIDGIIVSNHKDSVFEYSDEENLFMRNVYCHGLSGTIDGKKADLNPNETQRIEFFSTCNPKSISYYDGQTSKNTLLKVEKSELPKWEEFRRIHLWDESTFPFFEDEGVVNVKTLGAKGDGKTDDTAAFKKAIENHEKIFVPRGDYCVSETLVLKAKTSLFGASRIVTQIIPTSGWNKGNTPVISTVDDASAVTTLSYLSISCRNEDPCYSSIHWMAGRNSIVRNIYCDLLAKGGNVKGGQKFYNIYITGNGGGRWYSCHVMEAYTPHTGHPDHRRWLIEGTTEPLKIYALNTERVGADYQMEIRNSKNVDIYSYKTETIHLSEGSKKGKDVCSPLLLINHSENISVYGASGNIVLKEGSPLFTVLDSKNVTITCVKSFKPSPKYNYLHVEGEKNLNISGDQCLSFFNIK